MLLIPCPLCGARNESEFQAAGPARAPRPDQPGELDDAAWVDYLTVNHNPVGPVVEKWWHVRGCGMWFAVQRNTLTHEILAQGKHGA